MRRVLLQTYLLVGALRRFSGKFPPFSPPSPPPDAVGRPSPPRARCHQPGRHTGAADERGTRDALGAREVLLRPVRPPALTRANALLAAACTHVDLCGSPPAKWSSGWRRARHSLRMPASPRASRTLARHAHPSLPPFSSNGFLVVRDVFTADEVATANAAIDANIDQLRSRDALALRNAKDGTPMSAEGPRKDMGGMLWWDQPHCEFFRSVLTHPKLVPYYTALCGEGYRLDHQPLVIAQSAGSEGFALHGGPISGADGVPEGVFNPELQYRCVGGQMWTSLLAASVQLCDHSPGDGGFAIVRGSHKLNLPVPVDVANGLGGIGASTPPVHLVAARHLNANRACSHAHLPHSQSFHALNFTTQASTSISQRPRRATLCFGPRLLFMVRHLGEQSTSDESLYIGSHRQTWGTAVAILASHLRCEASRTLSLSGLA